MPVHADGLRMLSVRHATATPSGSEAPTFITSKGLCPFPTPLEFAALHLFPACCDPRRNGSFPTLPGEAVTDAQDDSEEEEDAMTTSEVARLFNVFAPCYDRCVPSVQALG